MSPQVLHRVMPPVAIRASRGHTLRRSISASSLNRWHFPARAGSQHGAGLSPAGTEWSPCPHPECAEHRRGRLCHPQGLHPREKGTLCAQPAVANATWHLKQAHPRWSHVRCGGGCRPSKGRAPRHPGWRPTAVTPPRSPGAISKSSATARGHSESER